MLFVQSLRYGEEIEAAPLFSVDINNKVRVMHVSLYTVQKCTLWNNWNSRLIRQGLFLRWKLPPSNLPPPDQIGNTIIISMCI